MEEVFKNTRTGASTAELNAFKTENESEAMARLKAAGWSFTGDYYFDEDKKQFFRGKKPDGMPDMDSEQDD